VEVNKIYNMNCLEGMKEIPDKYFELAIVDPPYFEGAGDPAYYRSRTCQSKAKPIIETWNIPGEDYFAELFRVSKKQIIWGCNYFAKYIPYCSRIVWDKVNDGTPFSQAEIASWSEGVKVYMFRYRWNGMIQQDMKNKEFRFHPTQKPVALYKWLLNNYAKPGDKILDTHVGSASSFIAAYDLGFDILGFEIDKEYFDLANKRIEQHKSQMRILF
jgi:site-specific DNA-methyltransferase (adenine-specific)